MANYRPAGESSDDDYDDDYGGFSFGFDGDKYESASARSQQPVVESAANAAIRLRNERDSEVISIIQDGSLEELVEAHRNPPSFSLSEPLCRDWTALMHAAFETRIEMVDWLIGIGASVNQRCVDTTPLMAASMPANRNEEDVLTVVQLLFNNGAVLNVGDRNNRTAFMMLVGNGYEKVVRFALDHVGLDACDNEGHSALFYAIEAKHQGIVKLLIENGANMDLQDNMGIDLKNWAIKTGFEWMEEYFPDVYEYVVPAEFLSMSRPDELAPTVLPNPKVPAFFFDLRRMLIHMDCGQFEQQFAEANITLMDFLAMTDDRLREIGVVYAFQRNRIRNTLLRFHRKRFSPHVFRQFKSSETTADLFSTLAGDLKQLLIAEATAIFLINNGLQADESYASQLSDIVSELRDIRPRLAVVQTLVEKIHKQSGKPIEYVQPGAAIRNRKHRLIGAKTYAISIVVAGVLAGAGWSLLRLH